MGWQFFSNTNMNTKIAIIGGGNLGTAIAEGLISSGFSKASDIVVTKRNLHTLKHLKEKGVGITSNNNEAVAGANIVVLAIKPFQTSDLLASIKADLNERQMLVSVVTVVTISDIQQAIGKKTAIIRAMPNTAIAIQQSMTCLAGVEASENQRAVITDLFNTLGQSVWIDEKLMEAATVLGACGTAYAMRYIRANIQGGIEIGFDAATASLIAAQTVKGAAELLLQRGTHPEQEIDKVTTPKGCTIAGLNEMEHQGFSSSLIRGITISYNKIAKEK